MTPIKRRVAAVTAPLLLALSLTACGGGSSGASGAPEDASKDGFCEAYDYAPDFPDDINSVSEDEQVKAISDGLAEIKQKLNDVGTPEDIPAEAREGFELSLDAANDVSDDDIRKALSDDTDPFEETFDDTEQKKVDAFDKWASDYC